ncbi:MAG: purine-nucleoside phosphorylase [bacterium]
MTKTNCAEEVNKTVGWLRERTGGRTPVAGLIMGSGLSAAAPELEDVSVIPYTEIPGFPQTTVPGHEGQLLFGKFSGKQVVIMKGRFHYYEGHEMGALSLPIRALGFMGVKSLIITSAVGSLHTSLKPGDLVVLKDHINLMGNNPLRGTYDRAFGKMFPDMTEPYDRELREAALMECRNAGIRATEGVYVAVIGPSYETPAEIRAFRGMGADVVGMSVVPEVISARQLNIRVLGLSWITNLGSGLTKAPLSHPDVLREGEKVAQKVKGLMESLLKLPII